MPVVYQATKPSTKALGKRPMRNGVGAAPSSLSALTPSANSAVPDEEIDEGNLSQSAGGAQARLNNKRVLPSRMRRGGVASTVGTNEIDVNILDTLKRKGENDPLIPARTVFILTTDSSLVPSASTSGIGLNNIANERYFERPEVIKAYKLQQDIQVPEFTPLEGGTVGGRFRARTGEMEPYELSDEAYEKRHRKHEMIEKRQRLREKEKLQHEHYKLKERIDQLRNVDGNAFLALPNDAFGTSEDVSNIDLLDGASSHEAERRRKLMLDVALSLEERYRTLLPPAERKLAEARQANSRTSASAEPSIADEDVVGAPDNLNQEVAHFDSRSKPLKLKLSMRRSAQVTPSSSVPPESSRRRKGTSARIETPPPPSEELHQGESITVIAPHSISSQQKKSRSGRKSTRTVSTAPTPPDTASGAYVSQTSNQIQCAIANHLPVHNTVSNVAHEGLPSGGVALGEISLASLMERRRQSTMPQEEQYSNIIHYGGPEERKPTHRKKQKQLQYITYNPDLPEHDIAQATQAPEHSPETRHNNLHHEDVVRVERPSLQLPVQEQPPAEVVDVEMAEVEEVPPPPWSPAGWEKLRLPVPEEQSVLFAQLRQLAQPDQEGDIDVTDRHEVNETPTADEPITPPVGLETAADSIITSKHDTYLVPAALEAMTKKRRRRSTPLHREPPISVPPEPLLEPESLSVISMKSYEIPTLPPGKGKKPKPLGALLEASKYNVEPGRKTSRSVKAFGLEIPPINKKKGFKLPRSFIVDILGEEALDDDDDSVAESDGDPPPLPDGMAHTEVHQGTSAGSISTRR